MAFLKWGSNIKSRKFDYIPRYYDKAKEEREMRFRSVRQDSDGVDTELTQTRIRAGFRQKYRPTNRNNAEQRSRLIRLAIIIVALVFISYYILSANMEWLDTYLR
ncbi:MAG: hypothetical protein ACI9FN_001477 [Saprospiraceae bacterium]|jgi:hypothetical protein